MDEKKAHIVFGAVIDRSNDAMVGVVLGLFADGEVDPVAMFTSGEAAEYYARAEFPSAAAS